MISSNDKEIQSKLYNIYNHINFRCYNEKCEHYNRYGGRAHNMDPSAAYKCAKGLRLTCKGYKIKNVNYSACIDYQKT